MLTKLLLLLEIEFLQLIEINAEERYFWTLFKKSI